jgi:hypothetical protein
VKPAFRQPPRCICRGRLRIDLLGDLAHCVQGATDPIQSLRLLAHAEHANLAEAYNRPRGDEPTADRLRYEIDRGRGGDRSTAAILLQLR